MTEDVRWKQRFENFKKALNLLQELAEQPVRNRAETEGMIQRYEYTFELAWKVLGDYLQQEGVLVKSPRETIKEAFSYGIIHEGTVWMDMLETRNIMSHTYDEENFNAATEKIIDIYLIEFIALKKWLLQKI